MSWKNALGYRQQLVLSTSSESGTPHAIIVISLGFVSKRLLIGASLMRISQANIRKNNKVSVVAIRGDEYYRIDGRAKIYASGDYLTAAIQRSRPPLPRHAVVIDIKGVFDMAKQKKIL